MLPKKVIVLMTLVVMIFCACSTGNRPAPVSEDRHENDEQVMTDDIVSEDITPIADIEEDEPIVTKPYNSAAEYWGITAEPVTDPDEARLLEIMEAEAERPILYRLYYDIDRDGAKELVGVCFTKDDTAEIRYCSSDGETWWLSFSTYPQCFASIFPVEYENETHIVVNTSWESGTGHYCWVMALRDGQPKLIEEHIRGNMYLDDTERLCLGIQDYDSGYDGEFQFRLGHTFKNTYVVYDGEVDRYLEIGARAITEEEFLRFEGAREFLDDEEIWGEYRNNERTLELRTVYRIRSNGIINIQVYEYDINGNINYFYFTLEYEDGALLPDTLQRNSGIVHEQLSELDVVF